eukprot:2244942-Amphidinium_carterae.1
MEAIPNFIEKQDVVSVPTVLFVREGVEERRLKGFDGASLDRLLEDASAYSMYDGLAEEASPASPTFVVTRAAEMLRITPTKPQSAAKLFQQALAGMSQEQSALPLPFAFRARLGLL